VFEQVAAALLYGVAATFPILTGRSYTRSGIEGSTIRPARSMDGHCFTGHNCRRPALMR
jgi:hypothetical protein